MWEGHEVATAERKRRKRPERTKRPATVLKGVGGRGSPFGRGGCPAVVAGRGRAEAPERRLASCSASSMSPSEGTMMGWRG